jgi:acetyl esterase/lipase
MRRPEFVLATLVLLASAFAQSTVAAQDATNTGATGQPGRAVDGTLLISCPSCDLAEWRKHMQVVKGGAIWERPVRSLSPLALVDGVSASAKIWLLVGSDDQIAPSALTLAFAEALRNRNVAVNVTIAPGLGHNILLEPIAMECLKEVASTIDAGR